MPPGPPSFVSVADQFIARTVQFNFCAPVLNVASRFSPVIRPSNFKLQIGSTSHRLPDLQKGYNMVYAVTIYKVRAVDVCAFSHAFGESGEWHRLHRGLPGYVHPI